MEQKYSKQNESNKLIYAKLQKEESKVQHEVPDFRVLTDSFRVELEAKIAEICELKTALAKQPKEVVKTVTVEKQQVGIPTTVYDELKTQLATTNEKLSHEIQESQNLQNQVYSLKHQLS